MTGVRDQVARRDDAQLQRAQRQQQAAAKLAEHVKSYEPLIAAMAPRHLPPDRLARLSLQTVRKDPNLLLASPESFIGSVLSLAALGLEIDVAGESYLVSYGKRGQDARECSPIVGYQGWSKLYYQHPLAADLAAERVFEADEFDYEQGTSAFLRHRPSRKVLKERGPVVAFYGLARLKSGLSRFVVLTPEECAQLRGGKVGPKGDIADPQQWMERKTALRQVLKVSPRSLLLARAEEVDDKPGHEIPRTLIENIDADRHQVEGQPLQAIDAGEAGETADPGRVQRGEGR